MLVNTGVLVAAVVLALIGVYSFVAGWNLDVDESDALVAATRQVGFPVGHASAQMGWRGLLSRPTWRILLYSADDPPEKRGLVLVDGVDGSIVEWFVEDNPEDWSLARLGHIRRSTALSGCVRRLFAYNPHAAGGPGECVGLTSQALDGGSVQHLPAGNGRVDAARIRPLPNSVPWRKPSSTGVVSAPIPVICQVRRGWGCGLCRTLHP